MELFIAKQRPEDGGALQVNRNCAEINQRCQRYLEEMEEAEQIVAGEEGHADHLGVDTTVETSIANYPRPALHHQPNNANMADFTIQNSFIDHQPPSDAHSSRPHPQVNQAHMTLQPPSMEQP